MSYELFRSLQTVVESVRTNTPISRRDFLKGMGEATIGIGLLYVLDACRSQGISFTDARENYRLRQKYIDQVVKENLPPARIKPVTYRHDVIYSPRHLFRGRMSTEFMFPKGSLEIDPQLIRIEVYRSAFDDLFVEDEFLSGLVDHEYSHIRQATEGITAQIPVEAVSEFQSRILNVDGDLFEPFVELEALHNQIKSFPKRPRMRDVIRNDILDVYRTYRSIVEKKEQTPLAQSILTIFPQLP